MSLEEAAAIAEAVLGRTGSHPAVGAVWVHPIGCSRAVTRADGVHPAVRLLRGQRARGVLYTTLGIPPDEASVLDGLDAVHVGVPWPGQDGPENPRCAALVLGWRRVRLGGLPEVTAKVAMSLDGNIATASGESQWITGPEARGDGHRLRDRHDAILVGVGTVLADDPRLTCRVEGGVDPVPVVLDTRLRTPSGARLFRGSRRPIVVTAADAPARTLEADVIRLPAKGRVPVREALAALAERGLHRVLVEGGAAIHRSLLDAGVVDTLRVYIAPKVLPGGRPWVGGTPLGALADAPGFTVRDVGRVGADVVVTLGRARAAHALGGGSVT